MVNTRDISQVVLYYRPNNESTASSVPSKGTHGIYSKVRIIKTRIFSGLDSLNSENLS